MQTFKQLVPLLLFYNSLFLFSQEKNTDNIDAVFNKKAEEFNKEVNFRNAQYFFTNKNWDSTLVYSMKQLSLSKNKELADYCHYFRGYSFRELKLLQEAKSELNLISKKFILYQLVNYKLGSISLELQEFEKAITFFHKAESEYANKVKDYKISSIYANLGTCYLHLKKFKTAEFYLFKSIKIQKTEKDSLPLINSYFNIATLYYDQYKDKQAIPYFEKAYSLSKRIKNFDIKRKASKNMAVVEENRGNFKQALAYRKESEQWKDSLNNQNKVWAIADYEKKYAVAQKQKQISVLKVENKLKETQRNNMFYSLLGLLILLIGGVYIYAQKVKNAKIILAQKEKLDELNATKDQLFSIVSHDLRSSVNALKNSNARLTASLETKNYNELDQLLHQNSTIANGTYSLLDNLLHWALLQTKQLYFHKDSVHLYSIVQQIEYNYKPLLLDKTIAFENAVSKNSFIFVDLDSLKIVLRNLLDNAIKFSPENSKISFYTMETKSNFCQLVIQDNGSGMNQETVNELLEDNELLAKKNNSEIIGTGLGMQLCKQMIKKNDGTLTIESESNKGTKIILSLPKNNQNG
ncbi:tetratricopeptide repeat-containing sensor histidine kinase [Flavobacterium sp.]|uniref:ATP-binding protein n=1 Tax=Flavobacterium sp. TaxID=239 RepID=UPI002CC58AD1|nr:tetratricopeptide repeat-containing sensor histidine kinase [Flavobacterium sp.]HSD08327.1 tetratricopeptide repeat-containing sensor histidine kinase [Flavobacterium sp.]